MTVLTLFTPPDASEILLEDSKADLLEWRVDLYSEKRAVLKSPSLLTLRSKNHGGASELFGHKRLKKLEELLHLAPDWIDLEWPHDAPLLEKKEHFPKTHFLLSYHAKGRDERGVIQEMVCQKADGIKYAESINSLSSALLLFQHNIPPHFKLRGLIAMGVDGAFSRVLTKCYGLNLQYTCLPKGEGEAFGQINYEELDKVYRFHQISNNTLKFALVGDPVLYSVGHIEHNRRFQELGIDAVYVKCRVDERDLEGSFQALKQGGFSGLSVTMPLKERIVPLLDRLDPISCSSNAVNTVVFHGEEAFGFNTDALAALSLVQGRGLLEKPLSCLILGAGGSAKAIAVALRKAGAKVTISCRREESVQGFCEKEGVLSCPFPPIDLSCYQLIINATPIGMTGGKKGSPINPESLSSHQVIFDLVMHPEKTELITSAEKRGCPVILGRELFSLQAKMQFDLWFSNTRWPT